VPRTLFVFGWGRVGSALGLQARDAGWKLVGAWSRSPAAARRARAEGVSAHSGRLPATARASLWILAVPDGELPALARRLAQLPLPAGLVVAHLAGSVGLEPLAPLAAAGAEVGSLHPFCAVAGPDTILRGATCALTGSPRARAALSRLARSVGLQPLAHPPRDRARYHLAASLLATATVTVAGQGDRLLRRAGLSRGDSTRALAGLLRSVASNIAAHGTDGTLTGPFARGDLARVAEQIALLRQDALGLALYRAIGRSALHDHPPRDRAARQALRRRLAKG
jgi:predicted short-subunit dehydrogenase-like oxidoreductase (DUF2520 family)